MHTLCFVLLVAQCTLPDGKKFKVGSGFTDADRDKPPKIGSIITFKSVQFAFVLALGSGVESMLAFRHIILFCSPY